jgi:hypothetical protein
MDYRQSGSWPETGLWEIEGRGFNPAGKTCAKRIPLRWLYRSMSSSFSSALRVATYEPLLTLFLPSASGIT